MRFIVNAVRDDVKIGAGHIDRAAVRQMTALLQVHAENGIAGFEHGKIHGLIGAGTAVRLNVDMFGTKQLLCTFDGETFNNVDAFAATIVAFAGITFSVFVGQNTACGTQNSLADKVLGCNQLDI